MRRPEREGHFDLLPLDELTRNETARFTLRMRAMLTDPATRQRLEERHLTGVLARHETQTDTIRTITQARRLTAAGTLGAHAIRLNGTEWAGMATIMPLALRSPRVIGAGLLPAAVTRRSAALAPRVRRDGPNITAWTGAEFDSEVLADAYGGLCELGRDGSWAGDHPWTIEAVGSVATEAIRAAGMVPVGNPMRYDDMEDRGRPPFSQLYEFPGHSQL